MLNFKMKQTSQMWNEVENLPSHIYVQFGSICTGDLGVKFLFFILHDIISYLRSYP